MKKWIKKVSAVALLTAMTLSMTACGGQGGSGKKYVIATDTVFRPFEFTNENGEFVGIDVDILAAIAEDQGFEYELQSLGWDAAVAAVQAGQADGLIAGATIKQERIDSGWIFLTATTMRRRPSYFPRAAT